MSRRLIVPSLLILAGCATIPPQQRAAVEENAALHVTCTGADDCEMKWARALDWVQQNSEDQIVARAPVEPRKPLDRSRGIAVREEDEELVAAESRQNVAAPERVLECVGDRAEHPVPRGVTEFVVDLLETIDVRGQRFAAHADERASNLDYFRQTTDPAGGPVHASAADLLNEMAAHPDWDYVTQAGAIGDRAILLVAATRDSPDEATAMNERMARALRRAGARHVRLVTYDDDHPFSSHRLELAARLTRWLTTDCAATQAQR